MIIQQLNYTCQHQMFKNIHYYSHFNLSYTAHANTVFPWWSHVTSFIPIFGSKQPSFRFACQPAPVSLDADYLSCHTDACSIVCDAEEDILATYQMIIWDLHLQDISIQALTHSVFGVP